MRLLYDNRPQRDVKVDSFNVQQFDAKEHRDFKTEIEKLFKVAEQAEADALRPMEEQSANKPSLTTMVKDGAVYFVQEDEHVIGCIHVGVSNHMKNAAVIYTVAVNDSHKGLGVGRALVRRTKEFAKQQKCRYLLANVVFANESTERLYVSEGFDGFAAELVTEV